MATAETPPGIDESTINALRAAVAPPPRDAVDKVFFASDPWGKRRLVIPRNEAHMSVGDPSGSVLDIEAKTRTRLKDGENPAWFLRLYHDWKESLPPVGAEPFAAFCLRRYPQRIDQAPAPMEQIEPTNAAPEFTPLQRGWIEDFFKPNFIMNTFIRQSAGRDVAWPCGDAEIDFLRSGLEAGHLTPEGRRRLRVLEERAWGSAPAPPTSAGDVMAKEQPAATEGEDTVDRKWLGRELRKKHPGILSATASQRVTRALRKNRESNLFGLDEGNIPLSLAQEWLDAQEEGEHRDRH